MDIKDLLQTILSSLPKGTNVTVNVACPGAPIYHCIGGPQFIGTGPMKSKKNNSSDSGNTSDSTSEEVVIIDSVNPETIIANDALNQTGDAPFETVSTQDNSEDYKHTSETNSLFSQAINKGFPHSSGAQFVAFAKDNKAAVLQCLEEACELASEGEEDHIVTLLSNAGMTI